MHDSDENDISARYPPIYIPPARVFLPSPTMREGPHSVRPPTLPSLFALTRPPLPFPDDAMYQEPEDAQASGAAEGGMSLNVHLSVPQTSANEGNHTPNTPEILNSIVSMQSGGPFAAYATPSENNPGAAAATAARDHEVVSEMSPASSSSDAASPASSLASTPSSAMSVQHYRSQFIKEGLKLKVRQKLGDKAAASVTASVAATRTSSSSRLSSGESIEPVHSPVAAAMVDVSKVKEELTEEDEMRRMRRRERNKVAATKCRNKKKMRTQMLIKESETLETQNHTLKAEIVKLEGEKRRLMEILSVHEPTCAKQMRLEDQTTAAAATTTKTSETPAATASTTFRVPAPPLPSSVLGQQQSSLSLEQTTTAPLPYESDQFLEDLKPQIHLNDLPLADEDMEEAFRTAGSGCGLENTSGNNFLAKRSVPYAVLDLDSRCIAL